jgi:hypothetical protein
VEAFSFDESWAVVRALLPDNLEGAARQTGFVKRLRGFDNAELILRLLLMHGGGLSLEQAATRAAEQGLAKVSAVTLFNRLQQSEAFLGLLAKHVLSGLQQRLGAGRWPPGAKVSCHRCDRGHRTWRHRQQLAGALQPAVAGLGVRPF